MKHENCGGELKRTEFADGEHRGVKHLDVHYECSVCGYAYWTDEEVKDEDTE